MYAYIYLTLMILCRWWWVFRRRGRRHNAWHIWWRRRRVGYFVIHTLIIHAHIHTYHELLCRSSYVFVPLLSDYVCVSGHGMQPGGLSSRPGPPHACGLVMNLFIYETTYIHTYFDSNIFDRFLFRVNGIRLVVYLGR